MGPEWLALGTVACGPVPQGSRLPPRPEIDVDLVADLR